VTVKNRLLAAAIIALTSFSCRTLPFPDPHLEGAYGESLRKWTRTVALYAGLETHAFARLIYLSPDFIEAQSKQIALLRAELPDQTEATREKMLTDDHAPTFFAIAYIPDRTANDWQKKDGSVWRIAINVGLGEISPASVQRIEPPFDAELRALYPYLDDYSVAYVIKFPEPAVPQPKPGEMPIQFSLTEASVVIAGALGKMDFHWRLDGGPETPSTGTQPAPMEHKHESPKTP
jgi:hypothetical protein